MQPLNIVYLFPELLNLYGDRGNVVTLAKRCEWRGISAQVKEVAASDAIDFSTADIVYIGGGADREQALAKEALAPHAAPLAAYVRDGGVVLAVCGGYQFLGKTYVSNGEVVEGLGIVDMTAAVGEKRIIGNAAVQTPLFDAPIVGFENHGGLTTLGPNVKPLGRTLGEAFGNNGADGTEGILLNSLVGTYLHGPVLPKNPQLADYLLQRALERRGESAALAPLDDSAELAANAYMLKRLGL